MSMNRLCQPIEVIIADVDGVLTDGRLYYADDGTEMKSFCSLDGVGMPAGSGMLGMGMIWSAIALVRRRRS